MQQPAQQGDKFLVQLAHEIRNSLGAIRSAAHLIARPDGDVADAAEARRALEQQIDNLAALIDTLLNATPRPSGERVADDAAGRASLTHDELTHAPPASTPGEYRNILIADDNDDAATSLAMILRLEGHAVAIAHDGDEAIELADALHPDVALLDISMPRKDGFEVAEALRSRSWSGACRLIALSGWARQADRDRALAAGFSAHLTKPIDIDWLNRFLQTSAAPGSNQQ